MIQYQMTTPGSSSSQMMGEHHETRFLFDARKNTQFSEKLLKHGFVESGSLDSDMRKSKLDSVRQNRRRMAMDRMNASFDSEVEYIQTLQSSIAKLQYQMANFTVQIYSAKVIQCCFRRYRSRSISRNLRAMKVFVNKIRRHKLREKMKQSIRLICRFIYSFWLRKQTRISIDRYKAILTIQHGYRAYLCRVSGKNLLALKRVARNNILPLMKTSTLKVSSKLAREEKQRWEAAFLIIRKGAARYFRAKRRAKIASHARSVFFHLSHCEDPSVLPTEGDDSSTSTSNPSLLSPPPPISQPTPTTNKRLSTSSNQNKEQINKAAELVLKKNNTFEFFARLVKEQVERNRLAEKMLAQQLKLEQQEKERLRRIQLEQQQEMLIHQSNPSFATDLLSSMTFPTPGLVPPSPFPSSSSSSLSSSFIPLTPIKDLPLNVLLAHCVPDLTTPYKDQHSLPMDPTLPLPLPLTQSVGLTILHPLPPSSVNPTLNPNPIPTTTPARTQASIPISTSIPIPPPIPIPIPPMKSDLSHPTPRTKGRGGNKKSVVSMDNERDVDPGPLPREIVRFHPHHFADLVVFVFDLLAAAKREPSLLDHYLFHSTLNPRNPNEKATSPRKKGNSISAPSPSLPVPSKGGGSSSIVSSKNNSQSTGVLSKQLTIVEKNKSTLPLPIPLSSTSSSLQPTPGAPSLPLLPIPPSTPSPSLPLTSSSASKTQSRSSSLPPPHPSISVSASTSIIPLPPSTVASTSSSRPSSSSSSSTSSSTSSQSPPLAPHPPSNSVPSTRSVRTLNNNSKNKK